MNHPIRDTLGPYRLTGKIGEGGMEPDNPVNNFIFLAFDFLHDEPRFLELRKRVNVEHIPYSGRYKMRNGADHDQH